MTLMDSLLRRIAEHKARLDRLHPLRSDALVALQSAFDGELTSTSIAIEGDTLTCARRPR